MKRKNLALLLALVLALTALCGCGGAPNAADYPVLPAADCSGMTLDSFTDGTITAQFPKDEWISGFSVNNLATIYLTETYGTETNVNINMQPSGKYALPLSEKDLTTMSEGLTGSGMTITTGEMRSLNGEPIVYIEAITQFTDEMLDNLIEQGIFTEADYTAMGGRQVLTGRPPVYGISITAKVDGWVCIFSGTYMEETHRQQVIDTMTILIQTAEISA